MYITRISSFEEYKSFQSDFGREFLKNKKIEIELREKLKGSSGTFRGYSYPAGDIVDLMFDYQYGNGVDINWRERLVCPVTNLNNRLRAAIHLADFELGIKPYHKIYISEQVTPLFSFLERKYPLLVGSEYLGEEYAAGEINEQNIRHEDMTALSFSEGEFDFALTYETLEHIPDFKKAFKELFRVLRKGGCLFWSVPFVSSSSSNIIRATINEVRAPIKLTMSRRSKLTTDFAGEDFQFMYDGAIQN